MTHISFKVDNKSEFKRLFDAAGLTQTKVAELMYTTASTVSRYLTDGEKGLPVSDQILNFFKLILATEKPSALQAALPVPVKYGAPQIVPDLLHDKLAEIKVRDPQAHNCIVHQINTTHRLTAAQQQRVDAADVALMQAALAEPGLSPRAASHAGKSATPRPPVPREKGGRHTLPVKAPSARDAA